MCITWFFYVFSWFVKRAIGIYLTKYSVNKMNFTWFGLKLVWPLISSDYHGAIFERWTALMWSWHIKKGSTGCELGSKIDIIIKYSSGEHGG